MLLAAAFYNLGVCIMKIITWNLNGLLSSVQNRVFDDIAVLEPDVICLQEIRTQQEPVILSGYQHFWNHSDRDGYSGTAVLTKSRPVQVIRGPGTEEDEEGRVLTLEFEKCFLVNAYAPNSQQNLQRRAYRMNWDTQFYEFAGTLMEEKGVVICGDFNVTRSELDIYAENQRQVWAQMGYASDERSNLESFLELGYTDVFRFLYPEKRSYTWWSNRLNKRKENRGWRLDYFFVSDDLLSGVVRVEHLEEVRGSDHCPVLLEVSV